MDHDGGKVFGVARLLRRPVWYVATISVGYLIAATANAAFIDEDGRTIAWLASAVVITGLAFAPKRLWLAIGGTCGVAVSVLGLWVGYASGGELALMTAAEIASWFAAALVLSVRQDPRTLLDRVSGLFRILFAGLAAGMVYELASLIDGWLGLRGAGLRELLDAWALAVITGVVVGVSTLLVWAPGLPRRSTTLRLLAGVGTCGLLTIPVQFLRNVSAPTASLVGLAFFVVLLWIPVRVGRRGTATVMLLLTITSMIARMFGIISPSQRYLTPSERLASSQLSLAGITIAMLLLAIFLVQRRRESLSIELNESRLRAVNDAVLDGIVTLDDRLVIQSTNPAALRLFGRHDLIGLDVLELLPEDRREDLAAGLREGSDLLGSVVEIAIRRQGFEIPVEASIAAHESVGARAITIVLRDITDRKRTEDDLRRSSGELERSNHDLAQFAYVASHDLQEPLRMVSFYVRLLEDRYANELGEEADEYIKFAMDGANRMQVLIQDLLSYSRAGTTALEANQVSASEAAADAVALLHGQIERSNATVEFDDLPTVPASRVLLVQVFQNLIGNALKFVDDRPPAVKIWAEQRGSAWCFAVRDHGIGIAAEYREKIFQPFQRLSSRKRFDGNGIGLAVCKKIVERHGGDIWVEETPGGGCTFRFTIPGALRKTA